MPGKHNDMFLARGFMTIFSKRRSWREIDAEVFITSDLDREIITTSLPRGILKLIFKCQNMARNHDDILAKGRHVAYFKMGENGAK